MSSTSLSGYCMLRGTAPTASEAVPGAKILKGLKTAVTIGKEKGDVPLPENESARSERVVKPRHNLGKDQVREGAF